MQNPRSLASYSVASSAHSASTCAAGSSSNCASRLVSTGSSVTMRTASMARLASAVIGVHPCKCVHPAAVFEVGTFGTDPYDRDVAEVGDLLEVDESVLVELEDGEEAHDHLEPLDESTGEPAER